MKRTTQRGIQIAAAALVIGSVASLAGLNLVRAQRAANAGTSSMPAVSADATRDVATETRLDASLAARVEVEGQHFDVYVGENTVQGTRKNDTWSVAVPTRR
jgi:hypothetical protein